MPGVLPKDSKQTQARLKTYPGRNWKPDFQIAPRGAPRETLDLGNFKSQVPVLVSAMAEETIQQAERKPRISHALGTAVPSAPAAVPDDPALPGLALLHRPQQFLAAFTPLLHNRLGSRIELTDGRLFVHRYVPGKRCIVKVEATMHTAPGMPDEPQCFFVKLYTGGHGARVYKNCQQLWRLGFSQGRFTIAEPLAYHPAWQALILGCEEGPSLREIVLAGQAAPRAVEGTAKWLHRLHTCGFEGGREYSLSRHLHILGAQQSRLASAQREAGRIFGDILDGIKHRILKLEPLRLAPTHRDFSPEHVTMEGDRFTGLDFDEFCQYHPLFDVAHFVAHLRFLALTSLGSINALDDLATHFEDSYASESADFSVSRLHLFAAIAYLKLAYVEAAVRHNRDGKQVTDALLEEAGRFAESEN